MPPTKKKTPPDDAAEEASEQPFEGSLTPIGARTLSGYKDKWGEEEGETKFQDALKSGRLDRSKMVKSKGK